MKPLFNISNLSCTYPNSKQEVLHVSRLELLAGSFIAIVGKSGSGKSTILETLGLMNRTMGKESEVSIYLSAESREYDYQAIWGEKSGREIQRIRNRHFSFIFQSTNLMPNFTALENVIISMLIQGRSIPESRKLAEQVMKQVGLDDLDQKRKTYELSGGQKQRLAFVRAIIPEFTVIFGDEPTGNLDETNSRELFSLLRSTIRDKGATAIIVTHNIDLAEEFADQILLLTKDEGFGEFLPENVFSRTNGGGSAVWTDFNRKVIPDIKDLLRSRL